MPIIILDRSISFPDTALAESDGMLAIGGDLSEERLLLAYRSGIFPWFSGSTPHWYAPDPRFVLIPERLYVSKSMNILIKRNAFEFTINKAFNEVITQCGSIRRPGQFGTWINKAMLKAYRELHLHGHAVSAEAWKDGQLAGGLYGVRIGKVFFGESMFAKQSNASKFAFIKFVEQLTREGVKLIDCQVYTEHLESLGAMMIPRKQFEELLSTFISEPQ